MKNYVTFVIDESDSMQRFTTKVPELYNDLLKTIQKNSQALGQDTKVQVVTFNRKVNSISGFSKFPTPFAYHPNGMTALNDAILAALLSHETTGVTVRKPASLLDPLKTIKDSDDVAHLIVVLTDGEENASNASTHQVKMALKSYNERPNYTIVMNCPRGTKNSIIAQYGLDQENVREWDQTDRGFADTQVETRNALSTYTIARSTGAKKMVDFYKTTTDLSGVSVGDLAKAQKLIGRFTAHKVDKESRIDEFVSNRTGLPYLKGTTYYQLTKGETIQKHKNLLIREKGKSLVYAGPEIRKVLGLPEYSDGKVEPGNHANFDIFVQSTSDNRKLVRGTTVLVAKQ